jgi:cytochrome c peroxidase
MNYRTIYIVLLICLTYWLSACSESGSPEDKALFEVPSHFPTLPESYDIPLNAASVELGRRLFYDTMISAGNVSCASCHRQEYAFSDGGKQSSQGLNGLLSTRNAPPIMNAAYSDVYLWDGGISGDNSLSKVAYRVFLLPNEFGADTNIINQRLNADPLYEKLFKIAFGDSSEIGSWNAARAIAAFMRTIISGNSRYDKYVLGDKTALNENEKRGMDLFFSERTKCASCHSGVFFTDNDFHSTGIVTHYFDRGRNMITGDNEDRGKFKTPTLRNIELTSPYMHNGEFNSLMEVLEHYNAGGKMFINKDSRIFKMGLSKKELSDLQAFLFALTDKSFVENRAYSEMK